MRGILLTSLQVFCPTSHPVRHLMINKVSITFDNVQALIVWCVLSNKLQRALLLTGNMFPGFFTNFLAERCHFERTLYCNITLECEFHVFIFSQCEYLK